VRLPHRSPLQASLWLALHPTLDLSAHRHERLLVLGAHLQWTLWTFANDQAEDLVAIAHRCKGRVELARLQLHLRQRPQGKITGGGDRARVARNAILQSPTTARGGPRTPAPAQYRAYTAGHQLAHPRPHPWPAASLKVQGSLHHFNLRQARVIIHVVAKLAVGRLHCPWRPHGRWY
jgi:hypothetical protein